MFRIQITVATSNSQITEVGQRKLRAGPETLGTKLANRLKPLKQSG